MCAKTKGSAGVKSSDQRKKSNKNRKSRIPPPQAARIVSRYISGQSIREISREESRDRETIARIVRGNEVQVYLSEMRRNYLSLGKDAIEGIRTKLHKASDVWFNHPRSCRRPGGRAPMGRSSALAL